MLKNSMKERQREQPEKCLKNGMVYQYMRLSKTLVSGFDRLNPVGSGGVLFYVRAAETRAISCTLFNYIKALYTIKSNTNPGPNSIVCNVLKFSQTPPLPIGERGEGRGRGDRGAAQRGAEPSGAGKIEISKIKF